MLVKIRRQKSPESDPYWQTFECPVSGNETVSTILDRLNYTDDLYDTSGNRAPLIRWETSCSQKMCGACAMVINGTPGLACGTFIRNLDCSNALVLEPLSKFPVISDLIVDRNIIAKNLKLAESYSDQSSAAKPNEYFQMYATAKCLKCGLCLEVCPNYKRGADFFGAQFANESYLLHRNSDNRKNNIKKEYQRHFSAGCSKALSCVKICPMKIDTLASMAKMNR